MNVFNAVRSRMGLLPHGGDKGDVVADLDKQGQITLESVASGGQKRLRLKSFGLSVSLSALGAATATVDLLCANESGATGEGELVLPLPEKSVVVGFAFDDEHGNLVPASVVQKDIARKAFNEEVRAGNTAALVEATVGNSFRTKVFPLVPGQDKRVRVEFTCEFLANRLDFPWKIGTDNGSGGASDGVDISYSFRGFVRPESDLPVLEGSLNGAAVDAGSSSSSAAAAAAPVWGAEGSCKAGTLDGGLAVVLPPVADDAPALVAVSRKDLAWKGEETFVMLDCVAPAPSPDSAAAASAAAAPAHPLVLWDASLSFNSDKQKRAREIGLLRKLLAGVDRATVVVFRDVIDDPQELSGGNVAEQAAALVSAAVCDGATDLEHALQQAHAAKPELLASVDHVWVFTDGVATFGATVPARAGLPLAEAARLSVFVSPQAVATSTEALARWALDSGGAVHRLKGAEDDDVVAQTRQESAYTLLEVATQPEGALVDVLLPENARAGLSQEGGDGVLVLSKLADGVEEAQVTLRFGFRTRNGEAQVAAESAPLAVTRAAATEDDALLPRLWAQRQVEELLARARAQGKDENEDKETQQALLKVARRYGIVCPGASLLVLTTLEQYLKHGIKPSREALPDLHDQYDAALEAQGKTQETSKRDKLSKVTGWWDTRLQWYEQDHTDAQQAWYRPRFEKDFDDKNPLGFDPLASDAPEKQPREEPPPVPEPMSEDAARLAADERKAAEERKRQQAQAARDQERESNKRSSRRGRSIEASASASKMSMAYEEDEMCMMAPEAPMASMSKMAALSDLSDKSEMLQASAMSFSKSSSSKSMLKKKSKSKKMMSKDKEMASSDASDDDDAEECEAEGEADLDMPEEADGASEEGGESDGKQAQQQQQQQQAPQPGAGGAKAKITLEGWKPDTPYIRALIGAGQDPEAAYEIYLAERAKGDNIRRPAFFMDVSTHFFDTARELPEGADGAQDAANALVKYGCRILSNLLEIRLEDDRLVRIVANRLWQEDFFESALCLLMKVQRLRGEEPQSHREVGMVQSDMGDFQAAWDNLWHVVETDWPIRFQHIEDEVLWELQRTLWKAGRAGTTVDTSKCPEDIFKKYIEKPLPMDVRLNIAFDADDVCIDLHIDQPDGTTCYYGNTTTPIGGWSNPDYSGCTAYSTSMLREYTLRLGMPGPYKLRGNYYSKNRNDCLGASTIWFTIWTNYMSEGEKKDRVVIRLENSSTSGSSTSMRQIGSMLFESNPTYQKWEEEWLAPRKAYQAEQRRWKANWDEFNTEKERIDGLWQAYDKAVLDVETKNEQLITSFM